jgi:RHS repeat-associated protein
MNPLLRVFYLFLAVFVFGYPAAVFAQTIPYGTPYYPVTAGTEIGFGGWYSAPVPPACTVQPAGSIAPTVAPKYGTLRYQNVASTLPAGYPCAGTTINSTLAFYTWNRTGPGEGYDYTHLQYTPATGPGTANGDFEPYLIAGIASKSLGNPKSHDSCDCVGDPVNVSTGNMFSSATDYTTAGENRLTFTRSYNSRAVEGAPTFATMLGTGWRSGYDRYINITSTTNLSVERPDGQQVYFTLMGSVWTPDGDVDITLTKSGSVWTLTDHDDTVETYTTTTSGAEALLNSIKARNGYTQTLTYNGSNQLTSVTDSYSRVLTLTYSGGLLSTVSTPDSTTLSYGYATVTGGTVLHTVSFPTSPTSTVTYNYGASSSPPTALTSIVDENGNTYESWVYDAHSRATQSQIGSGADLTTISYADDGSFNREVTNPFGVQDGFSFTNVQGVLKAAGIFRNSTPTTPTMGRFFSYDTHGNLYGYNDWNNISTLTTLNLHGDPTQIIEGYTTPVTRTTNITYDSTWVHLPHSVATAGVTTTFTYNTSGEVLTKTLTDTTSTTIPYSTNGQTRTWTYGYTNHLLTSVQSPRTDVTATTTLAYGTDGALTSITDALGHVTNITAHTGGGFPTTVVDPNSIPTVLTYDARQRLTTSSLSGLTTTLTVDPTGEITKVNPPDNRYRQFTYDAAHRMNKVSDGYLASIQLTLDALGNTTQAQIFDGTPTLLKKHNSTFDALGRKLTDVGGQGQTTTFTYDRNGNALTVADGLNQTTTRVFDALNHLSTSTDANSGVATWTYDAHNRILTAQDQGGHTTSYVYDGFGDIIQETSPDRGTTVYHYDNNGNLTSKTDALSVVVNQTFDKLDRALTTTYPADSTLNVAYTYDQSNPGVSWGVGRLTTVTDQAGTLTHEYDERGYMIHEDRTTGGVLYATSYNYDVGGHLTTLAYPDGSVVNYQYDLPGTVYIVSAQPAGASTATTIAPNVNHLPFGPLNNFSYGNGNNEHWYRDLDYRVTSISANMSGGSGPAVLHQDYAYDAANNVKTITDYVNAVNSQTLGYDVLNRLHTAVSGTGGYGSYTYNFDGVGNLSSLVIGGTTTNNTYAAGTNRLSAIGATAVTTNANGNITGAPIVGGTTAATYTYNKANRLSALSGGGSTAIMGITYDAFGRRITKADASGSVIYFYDVNGNVIAENNGGTFTDYVYVDEIPFAILKPTASPAANQINYVSTDLLGTPQFVANSSGTAVWGNTYKPFGQGGTPTGTLVNNVRLPGQAYDSETGFHYNLNRDYMPNLGRYLEVDPIGLGGGTNPYLYAGGNPYVFTDRLGLADWLGVDTNQSGWNGVPTQSIQNGVMNNPSMWNANPDPLSQYPTQQQVAADLQKAATVTGGAALASYFIPGAQAAATPLGAVSFCLSSAGYMLDPDPFKQALGVAGKATYADAPIGAKNAWSAFKFVTGIMPK